MSAGGRPMMPWHDTPKCRQEKCSGPVIDASENGGGYLCGACGAGFQPTAAERDKLDRAEAAWDAVLRGEAHEDKACAGCGGVLLIERFRLCAACVERDNAAKQATLF